MYTIEEIKQVVRQETADMENRDQAMLIQGVVFAACIRLQALRQADVSGSLPLPELVKELGETLEQSSVLIDLGAHRAQDDFTVNAHLQRVKEARGLYKHYKASCGNDR